MGIGKRFLTGIVLTGSLVSAGCKVSGGLDINVGEQNRGTVIGKMIFPVLSYINPSNIEVRLANSSEPLPTTRYRTKTSSDGGFLIEVPAGTYDVYGCVLSSTSSTSYYDKNKKSATVSRGSTVDIGNMQMSIHQQGGCYNFSK